MGAGGKIVGRGNVGNGILGKGIEGNVKVGSGKGKLGRGSVGSPGKSCGCGAADVGTVATARTMKVDNEKRREGIMRGFCWLFSKSGVRPLYVRSREHGA